MNSLMRLTTSVCCALIVLGTPAFAQARGAGPANMSGSSTSAISGETSTPGSKLSVYNNLSDLDGIPTIGTPRGLPPQNRPPTDRNLDDAQAGISGPGAPGTTEP